MKRKPGLKAQIARWNYLGREIKKIKKHFHTDDSGTFICPLGSSCREA